MPAIITPADRRLRVLSVVLCVLSFGWFPLVMISEGPMSNDLSPSWLWSFLVALFVPPCAMLALVLLARYVVHRQPVDQRVSPSLRVLSLTLGPIAWTVIVFRLTSQMRRHNI